MKQRPRADNWGDYWYVPSMGLGSVHDLADTSPVPGTATVLWVPDPEQRHGWREYYVKDDKPHGKPRSMGFKTKAED